MSHDLSARPSPEDLGFAEDLDAQRVEPGVILLERFVALEPPQHGEQGWSVAVSDITRTLGSPPHHRLRLIHIRGDEALERKLRAAIRLDVEVQPKVHGWLRAHDGFLLLTDVNTTPPLTAPLTERETAKVAFALASTLCQLHAARIVGIDFSPDSTHLLGRTVQVSDYTHLLAQGTAEEDVQRLVELLDLLSGGQLAERMRPSPTSANELWDRLQSLQERDGGLRAQLPSTPPFVGRQDELARLMELARHTRQGESRVVILHGPEGSGRTRLLERFALEVDRWMDATVLTGRFHEGAPRLTHGFVEVLDHLAQQTGSLDAHEREKLRDRIVQTTAPLTGMLTTLTPALQQWLGDAPAPPQLHVDERFGQYAATLAKALFAVGTPQRPLVVLLDDLHLAQPATFAVLRELIHAPHAHHTLVIGTWNTRSNELLPQFAHQVMNLEPLSRYSIQEFLERTVPGPLAAPDEVALHLWRASAGLPAAAWTHLQQWALRDVLTPDEGSKHWALRADRLHTDQVVNLYGERWSALPAHHQWVILLAALRSGRVTTRWLATVSGWKNIDVEAAVDAAFDAGLVHVQPDGAVRFEHEGLRLALEQRVSDEIRANGHRQIADWLDREPRASAAQRAWHRERSFPVGRDEALALLHLRGGQELLAIYDLDRARWHFEHAAVRTADSDTLARALDGRGETLLLAGDIEGSLADYGEAMDVSADPVRGLEIAAGAVYGFYRKAAPQAALVVAGKALAKAGEPLPSSGPRLILALLVSLVALLWRSRQSSRARDALCMLYTSVTAIAIANQPLVGLLATLRGRRHARGLDTGSGAAMTSMFAAFRGALGQYSAADRLLSDAEVMARRAGEPWGMGVVEHIRAQNELAVGRYDEGYASLSRALDAFRMSGDHTVAVLSLALKAAYGRNRAPRSELLAVIADAVALNRRHGNAVALHGLDALRLSLLARSGADIREEALACSKRLQAETSVAVDMINAHSYLAEALSLVGEHPSAQHHARVSMRSLAATPAAVDYMMDGYISAVVAFSLAPPITRADQRLLAQAHRILVRRGKTAPRFLAASQLYRAIHLINTAQGTGAPPLLETVIASHSRHRQDYYVFRAHTLLAGLLRGTHPAQSLEHAHAARAIASRLEVEVEGLAAAADVRSDVSSRRADTEVGGYTARAPESAPSVVRVEPLIRRLVPSLERALPRHVTLTLDLERTLEVEGNAEQLQLLAVNLVLAARDALGPRGEIRITARRVTLDQETSAQLPGGRGEAHVMLECRAIGYSGAETISGLGMCYEVTAALGGFVDVRQEGDEVLILAAYLSTDQAPSTDEVERIEAADAVVVHSDARVRETVVSALKDIGMKAEGVDPRLYPRASLSPGRVVFVDEAFHEHLQAPEDARAIVLYGRGKPRPAAAHVLRVPFTVNDLETVTQEFMQAHAIGRSTPSS